MDTVLLKVQTFLSKVALGQAKATPELADEFAVLCKQAFTKTFVDNERKEEFRFRMSNVGRAECQLELEMQGVPEEPMSYSDKFKLFVGDLIEGAAVVVMKAAGVAVVDTDQQVSMAIGGISLNGSYDISINEGSHKVYDIKTASKYAFSHKFTNNSLSNFAADDAFGYVGQAACYSTAKGIPFGGWIAICKETGEWGLLEVQDTDQPILDKSLESIDAKIRNIRARKPFARCFTDEPESYYKKLTGNRVLGFSCGYCSRKRHCWPGLQSVPSLSSKAKNAPYVDYTFIQPKEEVDESKV